MSLITDRTKHGPPIIAVDFDGVIHQYSKGYHDGTIYDGPVPGAKDALQLLLNKGAEVVIHSARACSRTVYGKEERGQYEDMLLWLHQHDIPYTRIWRDHGKPIATVYIDDRAIFFDDWQKALYNIHQRIEGLWAGKYRERGSTTA